MMIQEGHAWLEAIVKDLTSLEAKRSQLERAHIGP